MKSGGPLAGVRVLDYSTTFSGPYCTHLLHELGADVIKVETTGGDITRNLGTVRTDGLASVFVGINRGKSSIVLDLKQSGDQLTMRKLVARADCVVHNMRLPAALRLGIDPDSIHTINPRAIHAVITGYGSNGPYAGIPAYDDTIQAASGLAALQSANSTVPSYMATALADKVAGMAAANAILAALFFRERSGEGQSIEVPMFETLAAFTMIEQWGGLAFVPAVGRSGYARLQSPFRRPYRTSDGYLSVVVYHEGHWRRFLEFIDRVGMLDADEFRTVQARNQNIDILYSLLASELVGRSTGDWLRIFTELDIPATRVNSVDDLFQDEHLRSVDFFQEVDGGENGMFMAARSPFIFSRTELSEPRDDIGPQTLDEGKLAVARWLDEQPRTAQSVERSGPGGGLAVG